MNSMLADKMKKIIILVSLSIIFIGNITAQEVVLKDGQFYKKGMLYSGSYTEYYENGNPKIDLNIKNGLEDGIVTTYYENGNKQEQRSFTEGKKDGLWINWNLEGEKLRKQTI